MRTLRLFGAACLMAALQACDGSIGPGASARIFWPRDASAPAEAQRDASAHPSPAPAADMALPRTDLGRPDSGLQDPQSEPDLGASDVGLAPDLGAPSPMRAVFLAQGHVGRTMVSCDDGRTWVGNRSFDLEADAAVCGERVDTVCFSDRGCQYDDDGACRMRADGCDYDHHPGAARGVAYGDGWFVTTWGWGRPGTVRRSRDGEHWEVVREGTTFGGMAFGNGRFFAAARTSELSTDDGGTWAPLTRVAFDSSAGGGVSTVRGLAFADVMGGRFVIWAANRDNHDLQITDDNGATWFRPEPAWACSGGGGVQGVATDGARLVIALENGRVCISEDGGRNFSLESIGGEVQSALFYTGAEFVAFDHDVMHRSPDGVNWTHTPMSSNASRMGEFAYSPVTGTFVAVETGWQRWYDRQRFYRSEDGVTWTELPQSDFTGSHPIRNITFGYLADDAVCSL